ncbi:TPA: hypothetical protein ACYHOP_000239 [Vibrio cholerae]|uniref:hypothetical protein n=1 Tax=Vibrio cholerae TaxID=666 RepID=UPI002082BBCD|nr:hypothetical protein VCSRO11_0323 [Vibrio cholerae]GHZ95833.1 hypothetical protein VCSRO83_0408 [Vibrio cholerae]HDZ9131732.1 hypothetical protein [Vibrio cholerae]
MEMRQLDIIKNIIKKRIESGNSSFDRQDKTLIIPKVSYDKETMKGSLNNEEWAFHVGYCFRDALDLQYLKRKRDKKNVYLWTQGPIISFKEGDMLVKKTGDIALQVKNALPMGWSEEQNEMYYGFVFYREFDIASNTYKGEKLVSQLEFLEILINGYDYQIQAGSGL